MKVLEPSVGLLSNFEVLELLQKRGAAKGPLGGSITAAEYKVYEYLLETAAGTQTRPGMETFVAEMKAFSLTEGERLQSVNLRPSTAVEVHLIVEDCDERMSTSQVERFLATVDEGLPAPPQKPEAEEGEEEVVEGEEGEGDEGQEEEEEVSQAADELTS